MAHRILNLLIIDDEPIVADSLAKVVQVFGFHATVSYSGEQAVELARTHRFDWLITDVVMPGMNGIETAILVRELQPDCRILLVSGEPSTEAILQSAQEKGHIFEIIAKPFPPQLLLDTLRKSPSPCDPRAARTTERTTRAPRIQRNAP